MSYQLRTYQSESCEATWTSLCTKPGNPVIVLPTGAGKSLVLAEICRVAIEKYRGRVMVLAHRKELLQQNAEKIKALLLLGITCGLYSAGLRRFATDDHVIVAGIQSIYKKAAVFGARHLVIIDEAHLVAFDGEGRYQTFLSSLRAINPQLRAVGLTATPYRTGEGSLCRADGLFQHVCYEAKIPALIEDGFLCPVTNQVAQESVNTSGLHTKYGEFIQGEVERLFEGAHKVFPAAKEIVANTRDRHSVLVFCAGVNHAQHVAEAIEKVSGERCGVVTGETSPIEREGNLRAFRNRTLRFLCNVDVLTTGFDAPCIDAIAVLRATMSPGLYAQIVGRGLRVDGTKKNCLLLDFGENIKRHGPIDAIDFGKASVSSGTGDAPEKVCPACEQGCPAGVRECSCGWKFPPPELKHDTEADTTTAVLSRPETFVVVSVDVAAHTKRKAKEGDPDTLRIDYVCHRGAGNLSEEKISEWVCLEHPPGFALRKAHQWWKVHSLAPVPTGVWQAIDLIERGAVAMPREIVAQKEGRFWKVLSATVDELPETWAEESEPRDALEETTEEVPF